MSRSAAIAWALALALSLSACSVPGSDSGRADSRFNVVLVSIDTLRADHLGSYGYDAPTSPTLDAIAGESVVFTQAIAQAPSTLHSHASLLTSVLPHHHRASWAARTPLAPEAVTLAEVLRSAGYATAAFTGGGQMDRVFGLNQGFDLYEQPGHPRFVGTVHSALPWLEEHADGRFFLFLHSYETHHPYEPEPKFVEALGHRYSGPLPDSIAVDLLRQINDGELEIDDADLAHIVALYDAEIRSMDVGFGMLETALREAGVWDRTLLVVTSDHGEEFAEHGSVGWHSHTLYDELLRVPLIVKFPRATWAGARVDAQVRGLDVAPTVLATLGLPAQPTFTGIDLSRFLRQESVEELVAVSRRDRPADHDLDSVRTSEWKLHAERLFHIASDPGETWDVSDETVEAELLALLAQALSEGPSYEAEAVVPTGATLDELKALGYLQ